MPPKWRLDAAESNPGLPLGLLPLISLIVSRAAPLDIPLDRRRLSDRLRPPTARKLVTSSGPSRAGLARGQYGAPLPRFLCHMPPLVALVFS